MESQGEQLQAILDAIQRHETAVHASLTECDKRLDARIVAARRQAAQIIADARQVGEQQGKHDLEQALARADAETAAHLRDTHHRAERITARGQEDMETAVQQALEYVLGGAP